METKWIIQLLFLSAIFLVSVTATPEEREWDSTKENYLINDKNVTADRHSLGVTSNKIMKAQYECYQKFVQTSPLDDEGLHCNRTWDGWLCWDDVAAGKTAVQNCPDYFQDLDPSEKVYKRCEENGQWFVHPESNRTWTNYSLCQTKVTSKKTAQILYYLAVTGHSISIVSLLISLGIFFYFKSLDCQRIILHKHLFFSLLCNSVITIINLTGISSNLRIVQDNPVGCRLAAFFQMYSLMCSYFWMLCEGIYLYIVTVVNVFAKKQPLQWYYFLGWGFPLIPACMYAVARRMYFNDNCWFRSDTHLLTIIHGPICTALLVNLFFLLNIVRVFITKVKTTRRRHIYVKTVRAIFILVPLLGTEFVLFPWRPEGQIAEKIFDYMMNIFQHYQGLLLSTLFCFWDKEVQTTLRKQWNRSQESIRRHLAQQTREPLPQSHEIEAQL